MSDWSSDTTRRLALWIDNDQGMYRRWYGHAEELMEETENDKGAATNNLADALEAYFDEQVEEVEAIPPLMELMTCALGEADWEELAEHIMADIHVYVVMWNLPGCLPEMEPERYTDFEAARDRIHDHLVDAYGDVEDENPAVTEALAEIGKQTQPFSIQVDGYVYVVTQED